MTPDKKMFEVFNHFVDALVGEEPHPAFVGPTATMIRIKRRMAFDVLHGIHARAMRQAVNRLVAEANAHEAKSAAEASARDKARDDAEAGEMLVKTLN